MLLNALSLIASMYLARTLRRDSQACALESYRAVLIVPLGSTREVITLSVGTLLTIS